MDYSTVVNRKSIRITIPWLSKLSKLCEVYAIIGDLRRSQRKSMNVAYEIKQINIQFLQTDYPLRFLNRIIRTFQQKQSFADVLQNRCSSKFREFHRKTPGLESLLGCWYFLLKYIFFSLPSMICNLHWWGFSKNSQNQKRWIKKPELWKWSLALIWYLESINYIYYNRHDYYHFHYFLLPLFLLIISYHYFDFIVSHLLCFINLLTLFISYLFYFCICFFNR